jgi:hypothetical protein
MGDSPFGDGWLATARKPIQVVYKLQPDITMTEK